jgi:hypothetical protein
MLTQHGCLENFSRRGRCHRFKMHTISQVLNPPGEPIDGELPPLFVKIVGPQFAVHFIAGEHVKDTTHNGEFCRKLPKTGKLKIASH